MSTHRLIKFIPLANDDGRTGNFERAEKIIKTGCFWCSKLWDLNDPMEGVFSTYDKESIPYLFNQKNNTVICSFSHHSAIKNPLLWGYYANGFKGIAIQIKVDKSKMKRGERIRKIEYCNSISNAHIDDEDKIMTVKKTDWSHEKEIRFLKHGNPYSYKIGEITNVYFGTPYKHTDNYNDIEEKSETLKKYVELRQRLEQVCIDKGIEPKYYYKGRIVDKKDLNGGNSYENTAEK